MPGSIRRQIREPRGAADEAVHAEYDRTVMVQQSMEDLLQIRAIGSDVGTCLSSLHRLIRPLQVYLVTARELELATAGKTRIISLAVAQSPLFGQARASLT